MDNDKSIERILKASIFVLAVCIATMIGALWMAIYFAGGLAGLW